MLHLVIKHYIEYLSQWFIKKPVCAELMRKFAAHKLKNWKKCTTKMHDNMLVLGLLEQIRIIW